MTLLEIARSEKDHSKKLVPAGFEATFVAADPARESWFAIWHPEHEVGLFEESATLVEAGFKASMVALQRPKQRGTGLVDALAGRLSLGEAIELFATMPASADVAGSVKAWASVVRFGLDAIARAKVLPWVSSQGWDTWRVDPLDADDLLLVESLAAAMPATGHCVPSSSGSGRIVNAKHAIRRCLDAVADETVRTAGLDVETATPIFREANRMRVRHLRPWVDDLASFHCSATSLLLRLHPPIETSAPNVGEDSMVSGGAADPATLEGVKPENCTRDRPGSTADTPELWTLALELRSQQDPSLVVAAADLANTASEVRSRLGERVEVDLLLSLRAAAEVCSVLTPLLEEHQPTSLKLDDDELDRLLDAVDLLSNVGVELHWPASVSTPTLQRRLVVDSEFGPQSAAKSTMGIASLLDVDWEFLLSGVALNAAELELLSEAKRSVVSLRGRWVRVDSSTRRWLRAKPPKITLAQGLAAGLGSPLEVIAGDEATQVVINNGPLAEIINRLQTYDRRTESEEPAGLNATLRQYQRQGLAWLCELVELGLGACLADDMGLGKTIQILALHDTTTRRASRQQAEMGPTLIICPTSLINNWEREAAKFLPGTHVHRFHGSRRSLDDVSNSDIVITTYGVVRSDHETLSSCDWGLVVADEAQNAKNPRSTTARSLRKLSAQSRIALTGTPVENHLTELWSIIDWILPGLLGNVERFRRVLAVPIERDGDRTATEQLRNLVDPFLMRRRKTDPGVAPDLPPKTELDVIVPLSPEQITLYRATVEETLAELARMKAAKAKGIKRHGRILSLLTSLKQITNHPAQFLGEVRPLANRSGKLTATEAIVDTALDNDESILIFSQYVAMGHLLVDYLSGRGVQTALLHGGLTVASRQGLVDEFQAGNLDVLVLSLKAGGTGLNLTKATSVIHYDRWWNPAVEDQATDRAYRIGQDQPVTVHRIIAEGTVEDRVAELLQNKRKLSDRVLNAGSSWLCDLDDADLEALVTLKENVEPENEADPIRRSESELFSEPRRSRKPSRNNTQEQGLAASVARDDKQWARRG